MTILQALDRYYDRIPDVAPPGWSRENFGFCIILGPDGAVIDMQDLRDLAGKKPKAKLYPVPAGVKRTSGIAPNFLWDKSAYVLGVKKPPKGSDAPWDAAPREHEAFVTLHLERLAGSDDPGLLALCRFLQQWRPENFDTAPFDPEMLDANFMFRLGEEHNYLHQRPAATALVEQYRTEKAADGDIAFCLVRGETAPVARLHPTIKGVEGAQTSGASLVSFNQEAFESYGQKQGENAPTSEAATFRYGTALNHLLLRGSRNRLPRPVGDATVVFWADASEVEASTAAEDFFNTAIDPDQIEQETARKLLGQLEAVLKGRPLAELNPDIEPGTRFHILGLSPNAARLSVRFWLSDDLDHFARRLARHYQDLLIEPAPPSWGAAPSVNRLLVNTTALQQDYKNIPPLLAGEMLRAVLSGTRYPQSLLAAVIIRLRAGDPKNREGKPLPIGWHAAVLRAVLVRKQRLEHNDSEDTAKGGIPVALDREYKNIGYLLGRLFAVYELAQIAALGRDVKATIRDRYFSGAAATPANIFPLVIANGQNHLSKARKSPETAGRAFLIERELNAIMDLIEPKAPQTLPRSLHLEDQAEFAIGYYHQRSTRLKTGKGEEISLADTTPEEPAE